MQGLTTLLHCRVLAGDCEFSHRNSQKGHGSGYWVGVSLSVWSWQCSIASRCRFVGWREFVTLVMQGSTASRHWSVGWCMMTSSNWNIFHFTGPLCGESPVPGEFPSQRPVTRSFDVFFDLCRNKRLSKQSWGWWFETPSCPLWRHFNGESVNLVMAVCNFVTILLRGLVGVCQFIYDKVFWVVALWNDYTYDENFPRWMVRNKYFIFSRWNHLGKN